MKSLLLVPVLVGLLAPHDFFVSILTIRHTPTSQTLDLTWQMTAHDIEHALENVALLKLNSDKEHPKADSILNAYFQEHLVMSMNGDPLSWTWVGRELEGETLFCFLQVNHVDSLGALTVSNTLLQDLYYEQQNIVHVEQVGRPMRSHTFILNTPAVTFSAP
ncbi:MAG: hypothetical protein IPN62_03320 [Flavobacteriales bacterium]|nr:hypothetical protein [Flavobacteriales bacterium]MBP7449780.1 hypothetical protein [Flavobacteriales bacterium]